MSVCVNTTVLVLYHSGPIGTTPDDSVPEDFHTLRKLHNYKYTYISRNLRRKKFKHLHNLIPMICSSQYNTLMQIQKRPHAKSGKIIQNYSFSQISSEKNTKANFLLMQKNFLANFQEKNPEKPSYDTFTNKFLAVLLSLPENSTLVLPSLVKIGIQYQKAKHSTFWQHNFATGHH